MKKVILSLAAIAAISLSSLTSSAQKPATLIVRDVAGQNISATDAETKSTAIAVSQSILEGNWEKLDNLLDKDYTYTGDGLVYTKDQYMGFMQQMRSAFSDFEMILEKTVVEKDVVSIRFLSKVVNTGKFMGAPANKKHLEVNGIFMRKVKDGKVMQEWQTTDLLGTMTQIGGGSLFFYSVFVGGFNVQAKPIVSMPNDFLHVNGKVENFDTMTAREKNKYVKRYMKDLEKKTK
jgi:predicted ester cyclase